MGLSVGPCPRHIQYKDIPISLLPPVNAQDLTLQIFQKGPEVNIVNHMSRNMNERLQKKKNLTEDESMRK